MGTAKVDFRQVAIHEQDLFFVDAGTLDDLAVGAGDEALAPELDAVLAGEAAVGCGDFFDADAVGGGDVAAVGDGVASLDQFPTFVLGVSEFFLFRRVPADGGRIEKDLCPGHGGESCGFGEPLVPADEHADRCPGGFEGAETGVAGGEIKLLVVERVVGDVHLAVDAHDLAVRADDGGGVVIKTGGATFKERRDDHAAVLAGELAEGVGGRAGNRLGQIEKAMILGLAEILGGEQFLCAEDFRPAESGLVEKIELRRAIALWISRAGHLRQADAHDRGRGIRDGFVGTFFFHRDVACSAGERNWAADRRNRSTFSAASPMPVLP